MNRLFPAASGLLAAWALGSCVLPPGAGSAGGIDDGSTRRALVDQLQGLAATVSRLEDRIIVQPASAVAAAPASPSPVLPPQVASKSSAAAPTAGSGASPAPAPPDPVRSVPSSVPGTPAAAVDATGHAAVRALADEVARLRAMLAGDPAARSSAAVDPPPDTEPQPTIAAPTTAAPTTEAPTSAVLTSESPTLATPTRAAGGAANEATVRGRRVALPASATAARRFQVAGTGARGWQTVLDTHTGVVYNYRLVDGDARWVPITPPVPAAGR